MKGSLVAIVTPMHDDGAVDYESFNKLFQFHEEQGTDGIVLVGTTGESATLSSIERGQIFSFARKATSLPLMAGVGSSSTKDATSLIDIALKNGIDDCLVVTPYYNRPSQKGLFLHYKELAKTGAQIFLYNVPGRTGVDLLPSTVNQLMDIENIVGLKEAVATNERFDELSNLLNKNPDFLMFSGDDPTFVQLMELGGVGVISVAANVMPKQIKDLCDMCLSGDFSNANQTVERYLKIFELLFIEASPSPCKYLLEKKGLVKNNLRLPLHPLSEEYKETIDLAYEVIA